MPRYEYHCPVNGRVVEVEHPMSERLSTWGELCERAWIPPGDTPLDSPVEKLLSPSHVATSPSPGELRSQGFRKLVRRGDGVYEDVTATDGERRFIEADGD